MTGCNVDIFKRHLHKYLSTRRTTYSGIDSSTNSQSSQTVALKAHTWVCDQNEGRSQCVDVPFLPNWVQAWRSLNSSGWTACYVHMSTHTFPSELSPGMAITELFRLDSLLRTHVNTYLSFRTESRHGDHWTLEVGQLATYTCQHIPFLPNWVQAWRSLNSSGWPACYWSVPCSGRDCFVSGPAVGGCDEAEEVRGTVSFPQRTHPDRHVKHVTGMMNEWCNFIRQFCTTFSVM